ncbi:MAG: hypothetical protein ACIALR_13635, partial [Blastopirellula sp. JB062]
MRAALLGVLLLSLGCGDSDPPAAPVSPAPISAAAAPSVSDPAPQAEPSKPVRRAKMEPAKPKEDDSVVLLNQFMNDQGAADRFRAGPIEPNVEFEIDSAKLAANAIRELSGERLTLLTDLPSSPEIDNLPAVFDAAFPLWCEYFEIDPAQYADWRAKACLMSRDEPFIAADLLPADLPKFLHGYSRGDAFWLRDQPS